MKERNLVVSMNRVHVSIKTLFSFICIFGRKRLDRQKYLSSYSFLLRYEKMMSISFQITSDFNTHSRYSTCILVITVTTYLGFRRNLFTTRTIALERATTLISLKWFSTTFLTTSMKDIISRMVSLILMIGLVYTQCVQF